jgi:hypothetical protein
VKISPALDLKRSIKSAISLRNSRGRRLVLASLRVYDISGGEFSINLVARRWTFSIKERYLTVYGDHKLLAYSS